MNALRSLLVTAALASCAGAAAAPARHPGSVPAAQNDGGPRNWQVTGASRGLNLREQPSARARIVARYAPGTILDNLGCRRAEGRSWCDVQQLGGGPRGYVAAEYLKPAISPDGSAGMGTDDSALRARQGKFDATGSIPCAQFAGQPMTECRFGVARAGGGYATVVVTKPDGVSRAIFFRMGKPISADASQADGYPAFRASKEVDLNLIRVGGVIVSAIGLAGVVPALIGAVLGAMLLLAAYRLIKKS